MAGPPILELDSATAAEFAQVHTVLTDIDDTLTNDGSLPAKAYAAIESLSAAGFRVIPITGRPAGWCDMIARFWPVAGVVGENGAFAYHYDRDVRRMLRVHHASEAERTANQIRLRAAAAQILKEVPGAALAADQSFRIADIAIDVCEDVAPLPPQSVQRILDIFRQHGATAKLSSIHVNAWFGGYDKLSMTCKFLGETFGLNLMSDKAGFVFVGDSPNDEPMFAALPLSIGVANVRAFLGAMERSPRFVTHGKGGDGFVEVAQTLLRARRPNRESPNR